MNVKDSLRSWAEPESKYPVDYRQLKRKLRPLLLIIGILWGGLSVGLLAIGANATLICGVTGFMLGIWMIPASLVIGAKVHEWYWIYRVFVGNADDSYLPPI